MESGDATRRLTATSAAVKIEPKLASVVSLRVLAAQASQFTVDVLPTNVSLLQLRESIGTVCDELCVSKRLIRDFGRRSLLLSEGWRSPILLSLHNVVHLDGPIGTIVCGARLGAGWCRFQSRRRAPNDPPKHAE